MHRSVASVRRESHLLRNKSEREIGPEGTKFDARARSRSGFLAWISVTRTYSLRIAKDFPFGPRSVFRPICWIPPISDADPYVTFQHPGLKFLYFLSGRSATATAASRLRWGRGTRCCSKRPRCMGSRRFRPNLCPTCPWCSRCANEPDPSNWRADGADMLTCSQGFRSSPGAFAAGDTRALWIGRALSVRAEAIRPTFLTMMADLSDWGELLAKSGQRNSRGEVQRRGTR